MWEAILLLVAKFGAWLLDRYNASVELKKKWFEFIKEAGNDLSSVKLYEYGKEALDFFDNSPFVES